MTYAVLALGFTLIFGVLGVLQFAHPQIFVAGGFIGYAVQISSAAASSWSFRSRWPPAHSSGWLSNGWRSGL